MSERSGATAQHAELEWRDVGVLLLVSLPFVPAVAGLGVVALGLLFSWLIGRSITGPLARLSQRS